MSRVIKIVLFALVLPIAVLATGHSRKIAIFGNPQVGLSETVETLNSSFSKIKGIKVVKFTVLNAPKCKARNLQCYTEFGEKAGLDYIIQISKRNEKITVRCLDVALADTLFTIYYSANSVDNKDIAKSITGKFYKPGKNFEISQSNTFQTESAISKNNSGTINIRTTPQNAYVNVNGVEIGTTPLLNKKFFEGRYFFRIYLKDYTPITEKVVLKKGDVIKLNYTLEKKTVGDNEKNYSISNRKQIARRFTFSILAIAAGGFGVFENYRVKKDVEKAKTVRKEYEDKTEPFDGQTYLDKYNNFVDQAHKHETARNILYGTAGGLGFLFVVSIPF